jgi:hypothetical protein
MTNAKSTSAVSNYDDLVWMNRMRLALAAKQPNPVNAVAHAEALLNLVAQRLGSADKVTVTANDQPTWTQYANSFNAAFPMGDNEWIAIVVNLNLGVGGQVQEVSCGGEFVKTHAGIERYEAIVTLIFESLKKKLV